LKGPENAPKYAFQDPKVKNFWAPDPKCGGGNVPIPISDDSISGFQFRYDIDTILAKYRDIDTISDIL